MTFNEFKLKVTEQVTERMGRGYEVEQTTVVRNNSVSSDILQIRKKGSDIAKVHYLGEFYSVYQKRGSIQECVDAIIERQNESYDVPISSENIINWELMRQHLVCCLINAERNCKLLNDVPHVPVLNLSLVVKIAYTMPDDTIASVIVNNGLCTKWGKEFKEILKVAYDNTLNVLPVEIFDIMQTMQGFITTELPDWEEDGFKMLVIANKFRALGAVYLIFPEVLCKVSEALNGDLILLPSSISELIAVPLLDEVNVEEMFEMVHCVNDEVVDDSEILSYTPYVFRQETCSISILGQDDAVHLGADLIWS